MIYSFNKLLKQATTEKHFNVSVKNQFNFTVIELNINNEKKTFKEGHFSHTTNTTTHANYKTLIQFLQGLGYEKE